LPRKYKMQQDSWNIAINTRHWLPGKMEGFGRYIAEIAPRLAQLLPSVQFYWLFDRKPSPQIPDYANVKKIIIPPPARTIELIKLWNDVAVPLTLKKIQALLYFSPDNHLSLSSNIPQVITIHDINFIRYPKVLPPRTQRFLSKRTPLYLQKAAHVITVSNFSKEEILSVFPNIPPEKISVIYNGVSSIFKPLDPKEIHQIRLQYSAGQPFFFVLGSLHERKNLRKTLEAFFIFKKNTQLPWYLIVTGRPLWKEFHIEIPSSLRSYVVFTGYLSDEMVAKLLGASHALLFCSLYEGFGLPLVEAFASEVPAITSNTSALVEIGQEGALLVDPHNPHDIALAMQKLATDPLLYNELKQKTIKQAQLFSWDKAAKEIANIFLEILTK